MMNKEATPRGRWIVRCDTPHCSAELHTGCKYHFSAVEHARKKKWAIGADTDACPAHHV